MNSLCSILNIPNKSSSGSVTYTNATAYTGTYTLNFTNFTKMYVFTSGTGTLSISSTATCGLIVCGGGGSGGSCNQNWWEGGGGGGGGGVIQGTISLTGGVTYTATVGSGGSSVSGDSYGNKGSNSSLIGTGVSETAYGGGGGGAPVGSTATTAMSGGSSGGRELYGYNPNSPEAATKGVSSSSNTRSLSYLGNSGGYNSGLGAGAGAGGGGAGYVGYDISSSNRPHGGQGWLWSSLNIYFGAGGGGGSFTNTGSTTTDSSLYGLGGVNYSGGALSTTTSFGGAGRGGGVGESVPPSATSGISIGFGGGGGGSTHKGPTGFVAYSGAGASGCVIILVT
jgi:hypothetical protein